MSHDERVRFRRVVSAVEVFGGTRNKDSATEHHVPVGSRRNDVIHQWRGSVQGSGCTISQERGVR
jgi:hypothetical protein